MQLTYDPVHNIAYIRFREAHGVEVETVSLSDEVNVDLSPDGSIYGIELLNANSQLDAVNGRLLFDLPGQRIEVQVPEVA